MTTAIVRAAIGVNSREVSQTTRAPRDLRSRPIFSRMWCHVNLTQLLVPAEDAGVIE